MAVWAVGDIQGCHAPLMRLLERVEFDPARDVLWCVGDVVNRGPDSLAVLRFLRSLGDACVNVLGNHDLHLLGRAAGEKAYRRDTLEEVLNAPDAGELMDWLRHRPLLHDDPALGWCMVHAGLAPHWTLDEARRRARRIESRLADDGWRSFVRHVHAQEFPRRDPEDGSGADDELAGDLFAVAALTRARYCTADGVFDWRNRAGLAGPGEDAWYAHRRLAWRDGSRVVFGHWAARGLVTDQPHVLGLDSGCVWGGRLTMARLDAPGPTLVSEPCEQCARPGG